LDDLFPSLPEPAGRQLSFHEWVPTEIEKFFPVWRCCRERGFAHPKMERVEEQKRFFKWKWHGVSWYGANFAGGFSEWPRERPRVNERISVLK
jgi:hypothetical protein